MCGILHINNMERRQALNELMRQEQNPQEQYEEKAVNYLVALTFKDLKKRVSTATQQRFQTLETLRDKPFWFWDVESHRLEDTLTSGNCCFNHIIGPPRKSGLEKPIFDYEKLIIDNLHPLSICGLRKPQVWA